MLVVAEGGVRHVLDATYRNVADAGTAAAGVAVLVNVASHNHGGSGTLIATAGGLDVVVKAMNAHAEVADVVERGCCALRNITSALPHTSYHAANLSPSTRSSCVEVLLSAIRRHPTMQVIVSQASAALANLGVPTDASGGYASVAAATGHAPPAAAPTSNRAPPSVSTAGTSVHQAPAPASVPSAYHAPAPAPAPAPVPAPAPAPAPTPAASSYYAPAVSGYGVTGPSGYAGPAPSGYSGPSPTSYGASAAAGGYLSPPSGGAAPLRPVTATASGGRAMQLPPATVATTTVQNPGGPQQAGASRGPAGGAAAAAASAQALASLQTMFPSMDPALIMDVLQSNGTAGCWCWCWCWC